MKYEEILELLPQYARGKLGDPQMAQIRQAVAETPALARELERVRKYAAALDTLATVKAPGDFVAKVNTKIDQRRSVWRRLILPVWPKIPLELAGLGVAALLVVMVFNPFTLKNVPPEVLEESSRVASAPTGGDEEDKAVRDATVAPRAEPSPTARVAAKPSRTASPALRSAPALARRSEPAKPSQVEATAGSYKDEQELAFAPEPPSAPQGGGGYGAEKKSAAGMAAPAPAPAAAMAPPPAPAAELAAGDEAMSLERRKLKQESDAVSVMTLAIDDRTVDNSDVLDNRRARSRETQSAKSDDGGSVSAPPERQAYRSVAEKAFALVEEAVRRHGGTITLRSSMNAPHPQRTYVVTIPRAQFEAARAELVALGTIKDIDLNLDASAAERISFRLGVTVE